MGALIFFFPALIFSLLSLLSLSLRHSKRKQHEKKIELPPGSMGWPFIGETLRLYSQDPNVFFSTRHKRHGEIFKTHILGCPCVMLASPEAARFVLVTRADLFKPTYPKSKEALIGPWALFFHEGKYHLRVRKLVQGLLYPQSLRKLVVGIEALTVSALASCADGGIISTYSEMKKLSFEVSILTLLGHLEPHYKEELERNHKIVDRGYNSFPTNLPGTLYRKALKARKKLNETLVNIISERKETKLLEKDLLSSLLNSQDENGEVLSDDQIADNLIGVLFAAQDTTASAMTWIIKYLHDHPMIFDAVKAEQKAIYESNGNGSRHLTWHQTRNMPFTCKVILESLRIASIISFTFREAVTDVEYKVSPETEGVVDNRRFVEIFNKEKIDCGTASGCLIPKGWKVMPLFRNIHHNPEFFADPRNFDPTRFEDAPKPNTFMPFGSGVHACPGNELAKLEMLILVHHLTSQFRFELVGSESGIQYGPFPVPLHGLPARFWKQEWTRQPHAGSHLPTST